MLTAAHVGIGIRGKEVNISFIKFVKSNHHISREDKQHRFLTFQLENFDIWTAWFSIKAKNVVEKILKWYFSTFIRIKLGFLFIYGTTFSRGSVAPISTMNGLSSFIIFYLLLFLLSYSVSSTKSILPMNSVL